MRVCMKPVLDRIRFFGWTACLSGILAFSVSSPAQQVSDSCVESMEDDFAEDTILLCSSPLPPVKTIHIEGSRGDGKKAGEPDCDTFRPDVATIRRYFSKARFINEQDWIHKLTWISCRVYGSMILEDGRKAYWGISANRSASVVIEGQPEQDFYLYCPEADCDFPPFW